MRFAALQADVGRPFLESHLIASKLTSHPARVVRMYEQRHQSRDNNVAPPCWSWSKARAHKQHTGPFGCCREHQWYGWCNISVGAVGAGMSGVKVQRHFSIEMYWAEAAASLTESTRTACARSHAPAERSERWKGGCGMASGRGAAPPSAANVYASWACPPPRDRVVSQPARILSPSPATDGV